MATLETGGTDRNLVARIERSPGGKAGYKQLVRELGLGGGRERRMLLEQLKRLTLRRELVEMNRGIWAIPRPEKVADAGMSGGARGSRWNGMEAAVRSGRDRLVSGKLDLHRDGFGFVRPDAAGGGAGKADDIFIPPNEIHGAMQGDLVLVDEAPAGRDGRRSGRIARVLTRRNPTVVGIFHYADGRGERRGRGDSYGGVMGAAGALVGNFVVPMDERVASVIAIGDGDELVVKTAESPHRMLGEEAKRKVSGSRGRASGEEAEAVEISLEGMAVDVEIISFPQGGRPARGRVIEVLGSPDAFGVDVEIMIRKHHIPHIFPAAVLAEADESAKMTVAWMEAGVREQGLGMRGPLRGEMGSPRVVEAEGGAVEAAGLSTALRSGRDDDSLLSSDREGGLILREDFRGLPIVTIDGETARDFDDAVLVTPMANGNTELQVHIADVSWYVRPGSAIDTEARVRGTSVYFPDRAVPMLPHALSSGMCSLLPNEDRLVLSCVMEIDPRGEIVGYRVAEGIIRSVRRCTYTTVQHCINAGVRAQGSGIRREAEGQQAGPLRQAQGQDEGLKDAGRSKTSVTPEPSAEDFAERERVLLEQPELPAAFDAMLELALRLNAKRVRRGSIDFDLPEPVVEFDPDGNMKAIVRSERGWSHRLIEEFMLSANECVATWLESRGIASIYRIHEMPDPKRIVDFEETAAGFGHSLGIGSLPVKKFVMKTDRRDARAKSARGRDSRAAQGHEVPESIPVTPQMYQKLVRRISGTPEERILAYLMLRSLKQARYAEKNEGHFALASPSYTHFTSPIRRYPDLIVHRLVRAMLREGASPLGGAIRSDDAQPWGKAGRKEGRSRANVRDEAAREGGVRDESGTRHRGGRTAGLSTALRSGRDDHSGVKLDRVSQRRDDEDVVSPIAAEELNDIAVESSSAERRSADAERELIEWKKMKFMADKIGDEFHAVVLSATKYGFFVELNDMFIEGLVPLQSLVGDHYTFRDTDRTIVGSRTGHVFGIGQKVEVILDRIDRQQRRLQFALVPGTEPKVVSLRTRVKAESKKPESKKLEKAEKELSPKRSGKAKTRARNKKNKGRR